MVHYRFALFDMVSCTVGGTVYYGGTVHHKRYSALWYSMTSNSLQQQAHRLMLDTRGVCMVHHALVWYNWYTMILYATIGTP